MRQQQWWADHFFFLCLVKGKNTAVEKLIFLCVPEKQAMVKSITDVHVKFSRFLEIEEARDRRTAYRTG